MKRNARFVVAFVLLVLMVGTGHTGPTDDVKFGVFSDPHFYDLDLGTTGSAFETYLTYDRKMLRESNAILDAALAGLGAEGLDFVLVSGDLTKDGEKTSHQKFAAKIAGLEAQGVEVYVVPGNHDVNNPHAVSFSGDTMTPVPTVTPAEFAEIYDDFGYGEALYRDPNSLSYVAEPAPGIWLLALDTCKYADNIANGSPETSGAYSAKTMEWVIQMGRTAKLNHKRVITMQHHGIREHYTGQTAFIFEDYVVDNWPADSETLAELGLEFVFTGHFHSHDVVSETWAAGHKLTDIETGSLVTYPSPYRVCEMDGDGQLKITSRTVDQIDYDTSPKTFPEHAYDELHDGMLDLIGYYLTLPVDQGGFGMDPADPRLAFVAGLGADAYVAHSVGDENPSAQVMAIIQGLMGSADPMEQMLGQMLGSIWTDLPPADLAVDLPLPPLGVPFALGQKLNGEMDGIQDADAFDVYLAEGTKLKVQVYARKRKGLAPNLAVFAPDGTRVLDLVSTKKKSKGDLIAGMTGVYRLVIEAGTTDRTGAYLVKTDGKMVVPKYAQKKVLLVDPTMVFPRAAEESFRIPAGTRVKVNSFGTAKKKSERLVPLVKAVLPGGEYGEEGQKFSADVPAAGEYHLEVSADPASPVATGPFTLKVKCQWKKGKGTVTEEE